MFVSRNFSLNFFVSKIKSTKIRFYIFLKPNRSNPGTPTQPRRPDFIGIGLNQQSLHQSSNPQSSQIYYEYASGLPPQHPQPPSIQQHQQQQQQQSIMHHNGLMQRVGGVGVGVVGSGISGVGGGSNMIITNSQYGSPQRRFLSEGELVRQGASELSYARTNNTVDNIRELAGSPQRGVYMWKDTSPGFSTNVSGNGIIGSGSINTSIGSSAGTTMPSYSHPTQFMNIGGQPHPLIITQSRMLPNQIDYQQQQQYDIHHHRSNPTSPTIVVSSQQQQLQQPQHSQVQTSQSYMHRYGSPASSIAQSQITLGTTNTIANASGSGYQPALRGGVPVFPPNPNLQPQQSPQNKRKQTPTRPMSFVRALEMPDTIELHSIDQQQSRNNGGLVNSGITGNNIINQSTVVNQQRSTTPTPERASVYDMNYEISV